uniref:Uncharacterized protein n=1 Tax=Bionectria ochroleuca TaxID=29856 RepID=A0A8H7NQ46_BIOOC
METKGSREPPKFADYRVGLSQLSPSATTVTCYQLFRNDIAFLQANLAALSTTICSLKLPPFGSQWRVWSRKHAIPCWPIIRVREFEYKVQNSNEDARPDISTT